MRDQPIYDWPLRIFHWLFAGLFFVTFFIGKTVDDDSPTFSYHILAGLLLGFAVVLRIIWGFVGTKHSRFTSLALHPKELLNYFTGILNGDKRKWAGHNPASSWVALIMIALALGLVLTGYLMLNGEKKAFKEVHEVFAHGFLAVALLHVVGVVLHTLRHKDGIPLSMVDGAKSGVPRTEIIPSSKPAVGLLFVGLVAVFATYLGNNFDSQKQTLNVFGSTLQLVEDEDNEKENGEIDNHEDKD